MYQISFPNGQRNRTYFTCFYDSLFDFIIGKKALDILKNISIIKFYGSRNMMGIFLEVKEVG